MAGRQFKMLCLFDFNAATGFATVSQNIIERFRQYFGQQLVMDIVAINYIYNDEHGVAHAGKPYYLDSPYNHQAVWPAIAEDSNAIDPLGRHEFLRLLREYDYNIVFVIQDPGVMAGKVDEDGNNPGNLFAEMKKIRAKKRSENRKQFKFVWYFPIDGVPLKEWFDDIDVVDVPVAYTNYGRTEVYKIRPDMKGKIKSIPHGIDTAKFYPVYQSDVIAFREQYFRDNVFKTIFGNINRNQTRKDIPATIFGFEKYLREYNKDSFLYLHMAKNDPQGWNLPMLLKQTSLVEGVDYMFQQKESRDIEVEELNMIYNSLDYYITTTTGEGWGLTVTEAMACKIPVIAPYHTSLMDIGGGVDQRFWSIDETRKYVSDFDNMIREQIFYEDLADIIDYVVARQNETIKMVNNAGEYALSLDWDIVCGRWIEEFEKLI